MNLPPLSKCYPVTQALANLYGGSWEGKYFKKSFIADKFEDQIVLVNEFLLSNQFNIILNSSDFDDVKIYETGSLDFIRNFTGLNQIFMIYHQPLMLNPINEMFKFLDYFREQRDWKKFHTSKNLALALSSEVGELSDLFLWDREANVDVDKVESELADIIIYSIYLADNNGINLLDAVIKKTIENDKKYPLEKSKGNAIKYNKL